MKIKQAIIYIFIIFMVGCYPDIDYIVRGYTEKIIVEGKIETGKRPEVYLSLNVPLWEKMDEASIRNKIIRDARVIISNGIISDTLTSKVDTTKFPPYVYFSTEIYGEAGKTYDLTVEKGGYNIKSQTSIPLKFEIDSVYMEASSTDSLRMLSVAINIDKERKNAYRIYTMRNKDKRYIETPILFNSDFSLEGLQKLTISPLATKTDSSYTDGKYFKVGERVNIKVLAIDSTATQFFKNLNIFSILSGNISVSEPKPLHSNISEPGFGIWYGCAVELKTVVVE